MAGHLTNEGLFGEPLPNLDDEAQGLIRFNEWPPAFYLKRMAVSEDEAMRAKVAGVLAKLSDAEDFGVRERCFEIAKLLPAPEAARLADAAAGWLRLRFFFSLQAPEQYLSHLIKGSQGDAALTVARAPLAVDGEQGGISTKYDRSDYGFHTSPMVEPLTKLCGIGAVKMFCDFLEQAAIGRLLVKKDPPYDGTSMTSSQSDDDQARYDIYSALIVAVRRSAEIAIEADKGQTRAVVEHLWNRGYHIYKRLALWAASCGPNALGDLGFALLSDRDVCGQAWCGCEYGRLARALFPKLSPEQQQAILKEVDDGPVRGLSIWIENRKRWRRQETTEEDRKIYFKLNLRDGAWHWRDVLPKERQEAIKAVVDEFGLPIGEADRQFAWEGYSEQSPISAAEIVAKPIEELLVYLKNFKPDAASGVTVSALGMELRNAVELDAARFAAAAESFATAGPHHVRRFLEGLENQVRNGKKIAWAPVLKLLATLATRAKEPVASDAVEQGEDPAWSWVLLTSAGLIRAGLYRGDGRIPKELSNEVWALIETLFQAGTGVLPENFETRREQNVYFAAAASAEGTVLEAAILFGWWSGDKEGEDTPAPSQERRLPDNLRALLDRALAHDEESDPGLRTIFGRFFDLLLHLDREWVSSRSPLHYGPDVPESRKDLLWQSHLLQGGWNLATWVYFGDRFESEVGLIGTEGYDNDYRGKRFVHYLMFLYEWGEFGLEEGSLIARFWERADAELREHAMWALTQHLQHTEAQLPAVRRERIHRFYEARVTAAAASPNRQDFREELSRLGIWLRKAESDNDWMLAQLKRLAELKITPPHPYGMLEWFESLLASETDDVIATVHAILEDESFEKWYFASELERVKRILTAGARLANPETQRLVKESANILIARGQVDPVFQALAQGIVSDVDGK